MRFLPVLALVLGVLLTSCSEPVKFNSTDISGAEWGKDFTLSDANGQVRHIADYKGKVVVLFFGYTQCPDVCPTTLNAMRETMKLIGPDAARVQVLFATLDPTRDTPQLLTEYVPAFDPRFIGLWGDEQAVATAAKEFKVFYVKRPGTAPDIYTIDHSAVSYAFDPQGRLRLTIRHGEAPERIASDLKQLLAGK
jgi:protein SCO1/2